MGCDIHGPFIYGRRELSGGRTWWDKIGELWTQRDYCLFAILADVRNDGSHDLIAPPRGAPTFIPVEDTLTFYNLNPDNDESESCGRYHEHSVSDDCHSQSWLKTDEVVEAQLRYTSHDCSGSGTAERTPNGMLGIAIAMMREAERQGYQEVFMGFCFDN